MVALADTACGYGILASLPDGKVGEQIRVRATALHRGGGTQVWDATVTNGERTIAAFRCTQLLLNPR